MRYWALGVMFVPGGKMPLLQMAALRTRHSDSKFSLPPPVPSECQPSTTGCQALPKCSWIGEQPYIMSLSFGGFRNDGKRSQRNHTLRKEMKMLSFVPKKPTRELGFMPLRGLSGPLNSFWFCLLLSCFLF